MGGGGGGVLLDNVSIQCIAEDKLFSFGAVPKFLFW
jgi:hypothetical protein